MRLRDAGPIRHPGVGKARREPGHRPSASGRTDTPWTSRRGFTLLELIVVLTIIGLLVGIALPAYQRSVQRTREAVLKENLNRMRDVINQYYVDHRGGCLQSEEELVRLGYLRRIPEDPITRQAAWDWIREPNPDASVFCIRDVRSLAPGRDSEGVPYSEY